MATATRLIRSSIFPKRICGAADAEDRAPKDGAPKDEAPEDRGGWSSIFACLLRRRRSAGNGFHDLRRQTKAYILRHDFNFLHVAETFRTQELHYFFH